MHQRRPYSGSLHGGWRRTSRGMMSIQEKPIPWEDGDLSWPRRFFQTPWTLLTAPQSFGSRLHARASTGGLRFVVCSLAASASLAAAQGINPSIGGSGSLFLCCLFLGVVPRRWMERNGRRVSSRHVASCVCYVAGSLVLLWALARLILVSLFGLELLWLGGDFGGLLDLRFTQPTWILLSPLFFLLLMPVCSGLYDSPLARAAQGLLAPFLLSGLWVWFLVNNATLAT